MATLQNKLAKMIPQLRDELKELGKLHGDKKISDVTVGQAYGGMRGVKAMICDTSVVYPDKGLIIRGIPIMDLRDKLPEEIFYLLCTGELPDKTALKALQKEYAERSKVPTYVWKVLEAMPKDSHPMAMLNTAILVMQRESEFKKAYDKGMAKTDYWKPMLEDSLNLLAKLPGIAAGVYRMRFNKGNRIAYKKDLDWGANYANMLGIKDKSGVFTKLIQLYLTLHCDHEGGNVSAFSCHTVGSALSDAYYAVSAGLNGLAGPLHGLANQECLGWVLDTMKKFNGVPSDEQIDKYAWETLNGGKVIPGYGHAVLRVTDPRFSAFLAFGKENLPESPVFQTVAKVYDIVPEVLKKHGKAKNPWPNVDAGSGALLYHFGLTEFPYYTVLFSVSRAMGMLSQLIINRAVGTAITRPKSVSTEWIKQNIQ
ncbi:MAG: type I citrate synthase [candidate division Zixibacteria bacterium HGW-Zixibacteria-1]|nr:MAG: type I citrate synthase [candidate division Zixibacteria bacterium HGW-Zixibacteria-1]